MAVVSLALFIFVHSRLLKRLLLLYLQHLLDTAESAVITATNRTQEELAQMGNGHDVPTPIKHAIMMLGAHWYNQRESVSNVQMHAVPDSLQALIKPYRKLAE